MAYWQFLDFAAYFTYRPMLACPLEEAVLDDFAAKTGLTGRQAEVLRLVYAGLSTEEIATRIGCAASTVCSHYTHIEARIGCHSLAEVLGALALFAARRRITPPRDLPRVRQPPAAQSRARGREARYAVVGPSPCA